jgi:LuxR family transcriptional regulator, maltose regulon positive regulatory protein
MNRLLLTTKLSIPAPCAGLVSRPRLTERLEQASRLALVVAPAGWGKSSVVSEWCAQSAKEASSVAWVSLDASDNDPVRFLLYIAAACDTLQPGLGETTRSLLQSPQPPSPETVLTILLNEISALDRSLTLVLDDYHLIENQAVHQALTFLLDHLPPNLRLLLTTRVDPPLPLSRMRVRGQLTELRASDLRFTHEEAAAFLNQAMRLKLDTEAVSRLEARTEGWIAGLQLAALSLQGRANPSEFLDSFTGSNRYIVDYLFDEVLSRQPEPVQTFLQETSILNRLCGPLCEAVTEQSGGQALLEQLEACNLFLIPLDEERRWYRYHHLFGDVLQARLVQQGGERAGELHGRAASWFEQQGMGEEAIQHALAGKHLEQAARLLERHGEEVWRRGGQQTLLRWLQSLPGEMVRSSPMLASQLGSLCIFNMQLEAIPEILNASLPKTLSEDPEERDIQGRLLVLDATLKRIRGAYEEAVEVSRRAYSCFLKENRPWRAVTLLNLGTLYVETDRLQEAQEALTEAEVLGRAGEDAATVLISTWMLAAVREVQGSLREAARLHQSALDYAAERKLGRFPYLCYAFGGLGGLHYQWNDLAAAQTFLQEGREYPNPYLMNSCHVVLLRLHKTLGDPEAIPALFEEIEASVSQSQFPYLSAFLTVMRVRMQPERKEMVEKWLEEHEARMRSGLPVTFPIPLYHDIAMLVWAERRLAQGQREPVRVGLETLLETLIRLGRHGTAVEVRVLLATLYSQEGEIDKAVAVLEPALRLAAKEGYVRVFLDAGKPLVPVLRQAAAQGIEPETVAKLLDTFREEGLLLEKQKAEGDSPLSEPLSERELEVLRLVAAGLSNPEIAEHLFLSVGTVKRHVYNIYGKMDVTGRVEAITRARELKLL